MDNIDNNIDSNINNSNTNCWFCQEQNTNECEECLNKETCNFWDDNFEEDLDDYKYIWYEMSYYRFTEQAIEFKHSELQ